MALTNRTLKVIDLFCGAGGFSLGFQKAGFQLALAADNYPDAIETYRANFGDHIIRADLSEFVNESLPKADVIIGGPPCQGFSSAGLRKANDPRNSLVRCFAEIVARNKPDTFVFENVEGFLTAENGKQVFDLLTPLIGVGYRIHLRKMNAANFGVAQHRKRVIAVGGLGWNPDYPMPTHSAFGAPGSELAGTELIPTPTLIEALKDLPAPSSDLPGEPQGHYARPLRNRDLERAMALQPGQTMRDLPDALRHESYQRRARRRVMDGTPTEKRGGAPAGIRRLRPDEPSKAITGGAIAEFLHPFEHRPLTIRECARLQGFPDDFVFYGSQSSQMQLIGNAVPVPLAQAVAERLIQNLAGDTSANVGSGCLLSFVPTLSSGFSPILKKVTEEIIYTFGVGELSQSSFQWD